MRYDIAIIGTGPAGLEAAITAKIRNKSILLLGSRSLKKIRKAPKVMNYLGLPEITGEELAKSFISHIDKMGITITEERASLVYPMGDYFSIQTAENGTIYEANAVILATGMVQEKSLKGENDFLGRGVSYCATCDGGFFKGKRIAVIADSRDKEKEVDFLAELADDVMYFPQYGDELNVNAKVQVLREKPAAVKGGMKVSGLQTDKAEYDVDGVFILRDSIAPSKLVPGLEIRDNHVAVNHDMETNIPGCFAAGDIAGAPYQYIKAAGQGNIAALSAIRYLSHS